MNPDQPGVIGGPMAPRPWRPFVAALQQLDRRTGWPILADASSGLRGLPLPLISGYDVLLAQPQRLPSAHQVLRLGSMPASRRLHQWLQAFEGPQLVITEAEPRRQDPLASGCGQHPHGLAWVQLLLEGEPSTASRADAERWMQAERSLQQQLDHELPQQGPCSEPASARVLQQLIPPEWPVMLASSSVLELGEALPAARAATARS